MSPLKSRKQWKWFYWAEKKGKLKKGTAKRWHRHTKRSYASLPTRVRKRRKRIKVRRRKR